MERELVETLTGRLEKVEDGFLELIERHPHLIKEPRVLEIMHRMKAVIRDLRVEAARPFASRTS